MKEIKWQFDEATMYSYELADELQKKLEGAGVVKDSEKPIVYHFCICLIHTRGVKFDPAKVQSESLKKLPDFLSRWQDMSPAELWDYRRKNISLALWKLWASEFGTESSRLMADPSELPESMLTDDQKAELARRDSPLA